MGQAKQIASPDDILFQVVDQTYAHGEKSNSFLRFARPLQEEERLLLRLLFQELRGRRSHQKRPTQAHSSHVLPEESALQIEGLSVQT